ncbi:hypothetical protein [Natronohydrobacter thiooxidans]|jgi:hypothetical protein|uniref:hypothetical protein n=1 Tax=Natronohydrobacter thiooxidans TaxID=87172 RepID=UPI000A68E247|nr:hypothetical protein [Natronohydrobacter thiooxidans]
MLEVQAKFLFIASRLSTLGELHEPDQPERRHYRAAARKSDFVRLSAPTPQRPQAA